VTNCTAALPLEASRYTNSCTQKAHIIHCFALKIAKLTYHDAYHLINYNSLQNSFNKVTNCTAALPLEASQTH